MTTEITNDAPKRRMVRADDNREFNVLAKNLHPHDIIVVDNALAFLPDGTLLNATQIWSGSVDKKVYVVPLSVTRQYENPFRAYSDCLWSTDDNVTEMWLNIDVNSPTGRALFRCQHNEVVDALGADRSHSRVKRFLEHQPSSLVSLVVSTWEHGESYGLCIDTGARMQWLRTPCYSEVSTLEQLRDGRFDEVYYPWEKELERVSEVLRSDASVVVRGPLEWHGTINLLNMAVADIETNLGLGEVTHYNVYAVDNSIAYCVVQTVGGPGFKNTMETLRTLFGANRLSVFYDKDVKYCAIANRLTYQDKREATYRQAARHRTIIDICIALYPLCLPNYIMLEFIDHLPMMWLQGHRQKIEAIHNCINSIDRVLKQRNQNKKQKS